MKFLLIIFLIIGSVQDPLKEGLEAKKQGKYLQALQIWEDAIENNGSTGFDPRLGFNYIELVSGQRIDSLYEQATVFYLRALDANTDRFNTPVLEELERIRPLLSSKKYKNWKSKLRQDNPQVIGEIKKFWKQLDPTPVSRENERLIEHWQRIVYSKENFDLSSNTIYNTDDRGIIYVKYGSPDFQRNGVVRYNSFQVDAWAREISDLDAFRNNLENRRTSGLNAQAGGNQEIVNARNLSTNARILFTHPTYDVWVYKNIHQNKNEKLIFLFGNHGETGEFRLLNSLDEFIPKRAFRATEGTSGTSVTPGLLLQLMLYDQFSYIDDYFAESFTRLENSVFTLSQPSPLVHEINRIDNKFRMQRVQNIVDDEVSSYKSDLPEIPINSKQYRFLNEKGENVLGTLIYSDPAKIVLSEILNSKIDNKPKSHDDFAVLHLMQLDKANQTPQLFVAKGTELVLDSDMSGPGSSSFLYLPHLAENASQQFSSMLVDETKTDKDITRLTIFDEAVVGYGNTELHQPELLSTESTKLEVSDIIIGENSNSGEQSFFDIVVRPDNILQTGKNMALYFEVYHLQLGDDHRGKFSLNYSISNVKKRLFGKDKIDRELSLTLNFQTSGKTFREVLEIETRDLEKGRYILDMTITDMLSGQEKQRDIQFHIE